MKFEEALAAMRAGKKVRRPGWVWEAAEGIHFGAASPWVVALLDMMADDWEIVVEDPWAKLDRYRCHKVVRAARIQAVTCSSTTTELLLVQGDGLLCAHTVNNDTLTRYTPVPGDYFVVYSDGYQSISPKKAFEEGYSLQEAVT